MWLHGSISCRRFPVSATWIRVTKINSNNVGISSVCDVWGRLSCKSAQLKSTQRHLMVFAFTCKSANWIVESEKACMQAYALVDQVSNA